jgi:hypothetical protein
MNGTKVPGWFDLWQTEQAGAPDARGSRGALVVRVTRCAGPTRTDRARTRDTASQARPRCADCPKALCRVEQEDRDIAEGESRVRAESRPPPVERR